MIRHFLLHAARRCGLPIILTEDGEGNPRWHWLP